MESTENNSGFAKADLDVFMGTIVTAYKAAEICEIFNALHILSVNGEWGRCWGIDVHHLGIVLVDAQTSSIGCTA